MSSASLSALSIKPLGLVDSLAANNVVPNTQHLISASGSANCRKRRAGLQPIDLSNCSKKKIGVSNETLTGTTSGNEADGLQTQTDSEDCGTDLEDGEESLKRLRLRSQSSFSPTLDGTQLLPSPEWHESQELLGFPDSSEIKNIRKFQPNLAELEGNQGSSGDASTSSPRHAQLSSSGLLLEDELRGSKYELVGDGRTCKAVEMADDQKNVVWHCQIIKLDEFRQINEIMNRMQKAAMDYEKEEFSMISNLLLPIDNLRIIRSPQRRGLVYMLLPDHYGTLHQLLEENELCCLSGGPARLGEERAQPILKQVAFLLEFCHRIGLYFRDFRLRKFVFTDTERTKIRVNNILDLYLAPDTKTDSFISREFIPAYVAPELIDKKNEQSGGKAADIWAFGVLIFTLLNGRYPFFESSPSPIALLRRIRAHRFSFPIHETISESARWLIHALLCQKPEDRPMAFQLLQAHWFRINHNSLVDKLAEHTDQNGEKGILERAKATSPTTAFFHLSSPAPVSTVYGLIRTSTPIGQVPASRRLISPITTMVGNNSEVESLYHRVLPHSTMVLDQQQPITSLTNQIRGAVTSKTVLESQQQSAEHSINRRGQPPAFVPISTFPGPPTIRDGRQFNAHRRQLLLIPANLAMNSLRISGSRTEREMPRKKKQLDEESENKDQIVPESIFNSGN